MFAGGCLLVLATATFAAPFADGNLVVVRSGDPNFPSMDDKAAPAYLDEYRFDGTLVQSIPLGDYTDLVSPQFTLRGGGRNGGFISRSYDGNYLTLGGYIAPVASDDSTSSANVRGVARVDLNGNVDTSTRFTGLGGNEIRSVASYDGSQFWVVGTGTSGRLRYTTLGSTTSTRVVSSGTSFVVANIFTDSVGDPQLFLSRNSNANAIYTVNLDGSKLPVVTEDSKASTSTFLNSPGTSAHDFFFLDANTLYVTDDDADGGHGVQKWMFDEALGQWQLQYILGANMPFLGLDGGLDPVTGHPVLVGTAIEGTRLYSITDLGPESQWRFIAEAAPGTMFHDVAVPYQVPEPATLWLVGLAAGGLLIRTRRR